MLKISDRELQDIVKKWEVVLDDKMPFDEKIKILKRLLKHDGYEVEEEKSLIEKFDSFQVKVHFFNLNKYVEAKDYSALYELAGIIKDDLLKQIDELKSKKPEGKAREEISDFLKVLADPEKFKFNPYWNLNKTDFIRKRAQEILSKIE
jgi:hypothetical protein